MATLDTKIDKAVNKVVEIYQEIEYELLLEIARNFKVTDEFLNADYWRLKKLEEMGLFNQDIIKFIARYSKKSTQEVMRAMNDIGIDTYNLNKLTRAFEDEQLVIDPRILLNNGTVDKIINDAILGTNSELLMISNKIIESTRRAYIDIIEKTYLKVSMGTHSYQQAILQSINELANNGLKVAEYNVIDETGEIIGTRKYDIASMVRRDTLQGVRNLSNNINETVVNELKPKYIKLSEHSDCRPQHFDWQGTIIPREDLVSVTRYGEIDGLGGINCRHYFEPYFGDKRGNELKEYTQEECDKQYDITQSQRYLERGIRIWKRKKEMLLESEADKSVIKQVNKKIIEWERRYKEFSEENNVRRDITRTTIK